MVRQLEKLFEELKIRTQIVNCKKEGSFLVYDLKLEPNGTYRKIERHTTEISLCLKSIEEPIIFPITDKGIVRMEVMMEKQKDVMFSDIITSSKSFSNLHTLPLFLGKKRDGETLCVDLSKMPHLLIGGATGSGKSVMIHTIINSLLVTNSNVRFALIDPKRVELTHYNRLSSLYARVAKDVESSMSLLDKLVCEMDRRFMVLSKAGVRNISEHKGKMPYIVMIIDELADLMLSFKKDTQKYICKLAQKSRACGIHIILATQRPSTDVITGLIKANFPARLGCKVSSAIDSRVLLDRMGAERLGGKGDAILRCDDFPFVRFKGAFITDKEMEYYINRRKNWWTKIWKN